MGRDGCRAFDPVLAPPKGKDVRRREFLRTAATFAIGAALGPQAAHAAPGVVSAVGGGAAILADRLLQAYPRRRSLEAIGDVFWKETAGSPIARQDRLADAIPEFLRRLGLPEAELRRMQPAAIRGCIETRTARDFSKGDIVRVHGWLLGETEARLCAIAALRAA